MGAAIGALIDGLIPFGFGILMLTSYFWVIIKPFHKKRWVLILSLFMILSGAFKIYDSVQRLVPEQVPTSEELINHIHSKGQFAQHDTLIISPYGFKLLIPSGYQFARRSKDIVLTAVKEMNDGTKNAITVIFIKTNHSLEKTAAGTIESLKSANDTYEFGAKQYSPTQQTMSIPLEVTKNTVPTKGYIFFHKSNQATFILVGVTNKSNWEKSKGEILSTLKSFSFEPLLPSNIDK